MSANKEHMIPVRIAEQAVEQRDKEIEKLKEANNTLNALLAQTRARVDALREAGDDLWYALRHKEYDSDAVEDWKEIR
jgi:hypothetical protein